MLVSGTVLIYCDCLWYHSYLLLMALLTFTLLFSPSPLITAFSLLTPVIPHSAHLHFGNDLDCPTLWYRNLHIGWHTTLPLFLVSVCQNINHLQMHFWAFLGLCITIISDFNKAGNLLALWSYWTCQWVKHKQITFHPDHKSNQYVLVMTVKGHPPFTWKIITFQ